MMGGGGCNSGALGATESGAGSNDDIRGDRAVTPGPASVTRTPVM